MKNIVHPQQTRLFDPYDRVLTEQTRRRLLNDWPGVFRHVLLELMPADALATHSGIAGLLRGTVMYACQGTLPRAIPIYSNAVAPLDPAMGRPSKELYSMAGLLFLKECFDWTRDQAVNAYCFHMDVHYALNLEPVAQDMSLRTLERYIAYFEDNELAKAVMADVTVRLVALLELKIATQRLDSTHIFSDMASFGRTRLMGVTIKRPAQPVQAAGWQYTPAMAYDHEWYRQYHRQRSYRFWPRSNGMIR